MVLKCRLSSRPNSQTVFHNENLLTFLNVKIGLKIDIKFSHDVYIYIYIYVFFCVHWIMTNKSPPPIIALTQ